MLKERTIDWTQPEAYSKRRRKKNPNGSWGEAVVLLGAFFLGWSV